jgi:16S rRNA (guanine527-N7)-methyltransferase
MTEIPSLPQMADTWLKTLGWQPNEEQQRQFQQLYEAIVVGNRQLNLTRITEPQDFWEKHLWDSLAGLKNVGLGTESGGERSKNVIDIGTGAGFPGIPVAIAFPNWTVTLLDSKGKKIAFLDTVLTQLNLNNVKTLTGRAEEIRQKQRYPNSFDLALVRAIGNPSICAEYALPLLKIGGLAILYRGHWHNQDSLILQSVVTKLGGKIESIEAFTTPLSQSVRHCVYLRKEE